MMLIVYATINKGTRNPYSQSGQVNQLRGIPNILGVFAMSRCLSLKAKN